MQACCHQDEVRVISNLIDEQFYSVNMQWFCMGNGRQRLSIFPTPSDSMDRTVAMWDSIRRQMRT
ncbi:hypothetical protein SCLCIDRAFT_1218577 [Scleroderma citrinum Foug A]|uniref:Uncharacterized protein n=1 Tax=Scleroderma citrinum Foug A TaxID=1036808 RepID=A0A0C3A1A6_9AGAM|nr:hypothetical protein SCLCIDRAFT_1218577 [Scleroderma citrinum Foug A]